MNTLVAMGAFAVFFVLAGYLRLRIGCSGDGSCSHCGNRSCTLKETNDDSI